MILQKLIVGDTLDFVDVVADFPASDGWTLKYRLVPMFATPTQLPITLTAVTYLTTDYRIQEAPATTAAWVAGLYTWKRWVEKSGARQSLNDSPDDRIELKPDPTTLAQGYDGRSVAVKALEDCKLALANFSATGGRVKRYAIAGREMEFDAAGDIVALVKYWENEVRRERAAKDVQDGKPDPRRIRVRMANA